MNDKKVRYIEALLYNYPKNLTVINNIDLDIEELKNDFNGSSGISYSEKTGKTNKFNSSVENEIIAREKKIEQLKKQKRAKEIDIERVNNWISMLTQRDESIIKLRYFKKLKWIDISDMVDLSLENCSIEKRKILMKIEETLM